MLTIFNVIDMYSVFENMTFDEIVEFTIEKYINEEGRAKLHKVYEKVMTSDKLSGLLSTSKYRMIPPTATDVISCLCTMPFFMFRSNWTQVCAAVLFFKKWDEEVNQNLFLLDSEQLKQRAISCYSTYRI
jgi:hypothetical protein